MDKKLYVIFTILVSLIVLTAFTPQLVQFKPLSPPAQIGDAPTQPNTIQVSGNGVVVLVPDVAYINMGVQTKRSDIAKAIDENNATTKKIKEILMKYGVSEKDIQTSNFSVYVNQPYGEMDSETNMSYVVDNTLNITLRDLNQMGKLIGEATRSGANNIYGIQFDALDKSKAISEARKLAYDNALGQAKEMASIMGKTLTEVIEVKVQSGDQNLYPQPLGLGGGGEVAAQSNVPISAGRLSVTVTVNLTVGMK